MTRTHARFALVLGAALLAQCAGPLGAQDPDPQQQPKPVPRTFDPLGAEHWSLDDEQTSVKSEQPITRASSSVTVISGDEVRRSGIRYLPDYLRIVPGLEVQRISATESNVSARGYNDVGSAAQGMLALVDGRQVYNEFFGNVFWDQMSVHEGELERIEVIRGPGSFLYGPNAMHGLVNFVTRSPLDYEKDMTSFSTSYGSEDSNVSKLVHVHRDPAGRSGLKASVVWDDIGQFDDSDANARDKLFAELRFEKAFDDHREQRLEFTTGIADQKFDLLLPTVLSISPTEYVSEFRDGFVKANYDHGELKTQVTWTGFESKSIPRMFYTAFELDLDTVDIDVKYSFPLMADHDLTVGAGFRYATFSTKNQDVSLGGHSTNLAWGYVQDEVTVADGVFLTAGVRFDDHSTAGDNVSPRAALVWQFEQRQSVRASAGYGFRNPSLREIWFDMPVFADPALPGPVTIAGNKKLEAEKIRSFELGYTGHFDQVTKLGVTGFYNLVDDLANFVPQAFFPSPFQTIPSRLAPENVDKEEAYGFEGEVEYYVLARSNAPKPGERQLAVFGNYAYVMRENRTTGDHIRFAPRHKANAGVRLSEFQGIGASLWLNYFDDTEFFGERVDDYVLVNGQVSYPFLSDDEARVRGQAFLRAFNLLDNDHQEHPQGDRYGLILTAGVEFVW